MDSGAGMGEEPEVPGDLTKGSGHLGLTWLPFPTERAVAAGSGSLGWEHGAQAGAAPSRPLCCSGLGYVLGSAVKALTGNWHWALRVSPLLFLPSAFPLGRGDFPASSGP